MNSAPNGYWKAYLRLILSCLLIWFVVSLGFGVLLNDYLNNFKFAGFRLGFWFAQQGAIYVFILLIFYYVRRSNKIDHEYGHEET